MTMEALREKNPKREAVAIVSHIAEKLRRTSTERNKPLGLFLRSNPMTSRKQYQ